MSTPSDPRISRLSRRAAGGIKGSSKAWVSDFFGGFLGAKGLGFTWTLRVCIQDNGLYGYFGGFRAIILNIFGV